MKKIMLILITLILLYLFSCTKEENDGTNDNNIQPTTDSLYCSFKVDGQEMYFNFQSVRGLIRVFDTTVSKDSVLIGLLAGFFKDEDISPSGQIEFQIFKKFKRSELQNEQTQNSYYNPTSVEVDQILEKGEKNYRIDLPRKMTLTEHINLSFYKNPTLEDTTYFDGTSSLYWVDSVDYYKITEPQKNSYFRILSVEIVDNNKIARVKGEFNVIVYSWHGECKILEDGFFCADFWHEF